jgi:4-aminobutyrate aminotransferase-like enzyme
LVRQVRSILAEHADDREWSAAEVRAAVTDHALYTWGATEALDRAALHMVRGDGVYFHTADGRRFLDFNSQVRIAAQTKPFVQAWVFFLKKKVLRNVVG